MSNTEFTPVGEPAFEGEDDVLEVKLSGCSCNSVCRIAAALSVYCAVAAAALVLSRMNADSLRLPTGEHVCSLRPNWTDAWWSQAPHSVEPGPWWTDPTMMNEIALHRAAKVIGVGADIPLECSVLGSLLPSLGLNGVIEATRRAISEGVAASSSSRRERSRFVGAFAMSLAWVTKPWVTKRREDVTKQAVQQWQAESSQAVRPTLPMRVLQIAGARTLGSGGMPLHGEPLHGAVRQSMVGVDSPAAAWRLATRSLCVPQLLRGDALIHCVHGVGHGLLWQAAHQGDERAASAADLPEYLPEAFPMAPCSGSLPPDWRGLLRDGTVLAAARRGCAEGAPGKQQAFECASGVFMGYFDAIASPAASAGGPAGRTGAAAVTEAEGGATAAWYSPCDRVREAAPCFHALFETGLALSRWRVRHEPARAGLAGGVALAFVRSCITTTTIVSERLRRACIFGVSSYLYLDYDTRVAHAALGWSGQPDGISHRREACSCCVVRFPELDVAAMTPDGVGFPGSGSNRSRDAWAAPLAPSTLVGWCLRFVAPRPARELSPTEHGRWLACVGGSMHAFAFRVAAEGFGPSEVDRVCDPLRRVSWQLGSARDEAAELCKRIAMARGPHPEPALSHLAVWPLEVL